MRHEDRTFRDAIAALPLGQRIHAWMAAMRKASGLAFQEADEECRSDLFEIEQSTPDVQRTRFREARDRLLGFNALATWLFSAYRLHADALMSRVTALLSLMAVARGQDTRDLLSDAIREASPARPRPAKQKKSSRVGGLLTNAELATELAAYAGAMLGMDDSFTRPYWAEMFADGPISMANPMKMDLGALLKTRGEPIERAIAHYMSGLVGLAAAPRDVYDEIGPELISSKYDAGEVDPVLAPVDAYLLWSDGLSEALSGSVLVQRLVPTRPPLGDLSDLEVGLNDPRAHPVSSRVVDTYELWVYGDKRHQKHHALAGLEWEPWSDYRVAPIIKQLQEFAEQAKRTADRKGRQGRPRTGSVD